MIMKPVGVPKVFPKCSQGNGCTTVPLFPTLYKGEQGTGTPKGTTSPPRCSQARVFPMTRRVKVTGDLFHGQVPDGAVYVGRAAPGLPRSPYANPFTVKTDGLAESLRPYPPVRVQRCWPHGRAVPGGWQGRYGVATPAVLAPPMVIADGLKPLAIS